MYSIFRNRHQNRKEHTLLQSFQKSNIFSDPDNQSDSTTLQHYRPVSYTCSSCQGTLTHDHSKCKRQSTATNRPDSSLFYSHISDTLPAATQREQTQASGPEYLSPKSTNAGEPQPPGGIRNNRLMSLEDDNTNSFYSPNTGHKYYVLDKDAC